MRHLLAVAALALSPLAQAESYSLLIYETPAVLAERDQPAKASAYWQACDRYAGALMQAGVLRGGTALEPGSEVAAATLSGYFVLKSSLVSCAHPPGRHCAACVRTHHQQHWPRGLPMNLNTEHLKRCIQTLRCSLRFFEQAPADSIDQEIYRNAIVKGYELAQETSFKLIKKALRDYGHSAKKLDAMFINELLRLSATHDLMTLDEVERWFAYRDNRNNTAHDYGENFAKHTLTLMPAFLQDVSRLEAVLSQRFGGETLNG